MAIAPPVGCQSNRLVIVIYVDLATDRLGSRRDGSVDPRCCHSFGLRRLKTCSFCCSPWIGRPTRVCTLLTFDSQDITYASLVVNDSITDVTREQTRQGRSRVQLRSIRRIMESSMDSIPSEVRDLICPERKDSTRPLASPVPAFGIRFQVRHGLGAMRAFSQDQISDSELDAVIAYLQALRSHGR